MLFDQDTFAAHGLIIQPFGLHAHKLEHMPVALSLAGWADIAQYVIAISAVVALAGAAAQLRISHHQARRERVFAYADLLNTLDNLRATAEHQERWSQWTATELNALTEGKQAEQMRLPNMVEEIACLYNRRVLDRDLAAELLGIYVEKLWKASERLIRELRDVEHRPRIFVEWEAMQAETWKRRGSPGPGGVPPAP
jgi:hypothetical protein